VSYTLYCGDALEVLRTFADCSIDAIVTDPPAGIAFMGKEWDKDKGGRETWVDWMTAIAVECLRVIKPGGHALVWAIPRTSHWTGWAWEDAGWVPRDKIYHAFGSGFPKSHNVSVAIDGLLGVEREVVGPNPGQAGIIKMCSFQLLLSLLSHSL
jgi:site-specific DNA-methyltransferase (adenine-specific)